MSKNLPEQGKLELTALVEVKGKDEAQGRKMFEVMSFYWHFYKDKKLLVLILMQQIPPDYIRIRISDISDPTVYAMIKAIEKMYTDIPRAMEVSWSKSLKAPLLGFFKGIGDS